VVNGLSKIPFISCFFIESFGEVYIFTSIKGDAVLIKFHNLIQAVSSYSKDLNLVQ
jgi:hypothetical protein